LKWTSGVGKKIRLLLFVGIRLHPKTSDSATLVPSAKLPVVLLNDTDKPEVGTGQLICLVGHYEKAAFNGGPFIIDSIIPS